MTSLLPFGAWRLAAVVALPLVLAGGCATAPPSAADVIAQSTQAMGATGLRSIRYVGEGEGFTFGQAYLPNGPWPKVAYHSVVRTVDYEGAAMREEQKMTI